jgi:hypothetical protein
MTKPTLPTAHGSQADNEHERLRSLLPEYAMIILQQAPIESDWQVLGSHLAGCRDCRDELDDLLQLLEDTYAGALPTDVDLPEIDLSCLPPWSSPDAAGEQLAVVERTADVVRQVLISFTEMLVEAMRRPHFAGEFRSGGTPGDHSLLPAPPTKSVGASSLPNEFRYQVHGTPPDNLDIAIDLTLMDSQQALYRVRVMVVDPQDPFAQDNHRVTLSYEAQRLDALTDTHGCVTFTDIPYAALAQMQLTIQLDP